MSMYRQLWLAIILSTLLALLGGLLASTLNARSYMSQQLSAKNSDNATSLALALSQQNANSVMIELTVSALFDSGHYELIRVQDPLGKMLIERTAPADSRSVPVWFVRLLPFSAKPGQAQISNGWQQLGTLTLVSSSGFAYEALWRTVLQQVLALALAGLVGGFLGVLTLRRLREPLQRVINQANAIAERRFVLIDEPDVPELKSLAIAMNSTVTRLKTMFSQEAQGLEILRTTANYDPVTGLANRTFFLVQLLDALDRETATGDNLLLVRVAGFSGLQQRLGQPATDKLLKLFAQTFSHHAMRSNGVAARIGDSDFALLIPGAFKAQDEAEAILGALVAAGEPVIGNGPTAFIVIGRLESGQDMAGLMAQASTALSAAEAEGINSVRHVDAGVSSAPTVSNEDTAQALRRSLDQGRVRLSTVPLLNLNGDLVHRECQLELVLEGGHEWQEATRFMHIAEIFALTPLMDLTAVKLGLEKLLRNPGLADLALELSALSLCEESFQPRLLELLRKNPLLANRLRLGMSESDAIRHLDLFRNFVAEVKHTGSRVGLKHFGRHFSQAGVLHEMGLDFLQVGPSFIRGLQFSSDNQIFLKDLVTLTHKMGMQVFAEGVIDRAELAALKVAGFDGVTGPAIKEAV
jgi:EAL domain-containing protein (putative c-di-GMP-specific phosphodiesterase class I)/GGDEF domain-containing protein